MGLGGDSIRSPEWCVRDVKKQTAITKVYEIELIDGKSFKTLINEDGTMGFKEYIKENIQLSGKNNMMTFVFRDGMIPIFDAEGEVTFHDFEDALRDNLIPTGNIDYSAQGPVVVFTKAHKTIGYDVRFAEAMIGDEYAAYKKAFMETILKLK